MRRTNVSFLYKSLINLFTSKSKVIKNCFLLDIINPCVTQRTLILKYKTLINLELLF